MISNEAKERVLKELLKKKRIRKIYDDYIIKTIPFEEWVRSALDYVLSPPNPIDADEILKRIMDDGQEG